jgi:hypothetical protein
MKVCCVLVATMAAEKVQEDGAGAFEAGVVIEEGVVVEEVGSTVAVVS